MTLTPKTCTTTDFLALASIPATAAPVALATELVVKVYNYGEWTWEKATDAELIDTAIETAFPKLHMNLVIGDRPYVGNVLGKRVCVEAR